jgi:hypothetical protein
MKIRSIFAGGLLAVAVAGGSVAGAGAASAHPIPIPKAAGSVALAGPVSHPSTGPIQYASFSVLGGPGRYHGSIDYANFTQPASHTNVWNISKGSTLAFTLGGDSYTHTMKVATLTPTSTHSTTFSGTGFYIKDKTVKWTITGTVNWDKVSFTIKYDNSTYTVAGSGSIKPDGSVSGTATAANPAQSLTFTMPQHSAFQVLRYTAPVTAASIKGHDATFWYTTPRYGMPWWLAGKHVMCKVHDGGPGFVKDTYASSVAMFWRYGPLTQYKITSGNIVVH